MSAMLSESGREGRVPPFTILPYFLSWLHWIDPNGTRTEVGPTCKSGPRHGPAQGGEEPTKTEKEPTKTEKERTKVGKEQTNARTVTTRKGPLTSAPSKLAFAVDQTRETSRETSGEAS